MKIFKKSVIAFLVLSLLLSLVTFTGATEDSFEENGFVYTVSDDKATIIDYSNFDYDNGYETEILELNVPSQLGGYTTTAIADNAFEDDDSFKAVILPDTIETIGNQAFYYCENLEEIVLSKKLVSIGYEAFSNCGKITDIVIPASVEAIGDYAFSYCWRLESITVEESNSAFSSDNGILFNKDKTKLLKYPAAYGTELYEVPSCVNEIGMDAFSSNMIIKEIIIPESVQTIGAGAFHNCKMLEKANLPENLTEISPSVFARCDELKGIVIPDNVTAIGDYAFRGCYSLTSVDMSDNITSIGEGAFDECVLLEEIELGDAITHIGFSAFNRCESLKSIDIPKSLDSLDATFSSCSSLTHVTVPSNIKIVGRHSFYGCRVLETIVFEEGITEICDYALAESNGLKSVTFPSTLKSIGCRVFAQDFELTDVYFMGTQEEWEAIEIAEGNEPLLNATIHFVEPDTETKGDIDGDGKINSSDALQILRHSVGSELLTDEKVSCADVDDDGIVNSSDALRVLQYSVGKITEF